MPPKGFCIRNPVIINKKPKFQIYLAFASPGKTTCLGQKSGPEHLLDVFTVMWVILVICSCFIYLALADFCVSTRASTHVANLFLSLCEAFATNVSSTQGPVPLGSCGLVCKSLCADLRAYMGLLLNCLNENTKLGCLQPGVGEWSNLSFSTVATGTWSSWS